jgi:hypothetical protein
MELNSILLYGGGSLTILVAIMHVGIPIIRGWYKEIKDLSSESRRTIIDRNSFLIMLLLIIAYLTFIYNDQLLGSDMGQTILMLIGIFWFLRAFWRLLGFKRDGITIFVSVVYLLSALCYLIPVTLSRWLTSITV